MHSIIILFLLAHIIGDYYFQWGKLVIYKRRWTFRHSGFWNWTALIGHVLIYTSCFSFGFFFLNLPYFFLFLALTLFTHLIFDCTKILFENKFKNATTIFLIVDQICHIFFIVLFLFLSRDQLIMNNIEWLETHIVWFKLAFCVLFIIKPASILVGTLVNECVFDKNEPVSPQSKEETLKSIEEHKEKDAGRIIGIIERLMVFFLGILSAWTAIAIVITAKTWVKKGDIEDKKTFKQQYLVGTLSSLVIAILLGFFYLNF